MTSAETADPGDSFDVRAFKIADAAAAAWWGARGGGDIEVPLGVVAALCLVAAASPSDPSEQIMALDPPGFGILLRHIWAHFAIARPDLCIRAGPFARWLEDAPQSQLAAGHAVARAVIVTGEFFVPAERSVAKQTDLLGCVYQVLSNPQASKVRSEVYTSRDVADLVVRVKLAGAQLRPGQTIADESAGTGAFIRAAAQALRVRDIDPQTMHWYAVDIDPLAVAALAVNATVWGLGSHVVLGHADIVTEPEWTTRAHAEQARALRDHDLRLTVARILAADYVITQDGPPEWGAALRL
jgi:hypothetical protein